MGITAARAQTENSTVTGAFVVERPTLLSLGFEWQISGDDNRNAIVTVSSRKTSETTWRKGMPLMRMSGEFVPAPCRISATATITNTPCPTISPASS